nr:aldo/keto reductase [Pseudonocardia acidicola]
MSTESNYALLGELERFARDRGHTVGELAIAWLLANPLVGSVITGVSNPAQLEANVVAAGWHLSAEDKRAVDAIVSGPAGPPDPERPPYPRLQRRPHSGARVRPRGVIRDAGSETMSIDPALGTGIPTFGLAVDPETQREVEQFLFFEARLLDERRFSEWYDLFSDDVHYWMPARYNRLLREMDKEVARPGEIANFDEDKRSLGQRVFRMNTGMAWAEDPPSRHQRLRATR